MAIVVINRTSEYVNMLRDYQIYIDGKKVGTIANGKTKEFNVSSGQHHLVAKIDWCSSSTITFEVGDKGIKQFQIGAFKNSKWLLPSAIFIAVASYFMSKTVGLQYFFYLPVLGIIILSYYVTIGSKRYLTLEEGV